jgi:hypothetical protein
MAYRIVKVSHLNDTIVEILSLWLANFYKNHPDADSREGNVEADGSATLLEDSSLSALQDCIELYIEQQKSDDDDGESDDDDDDDDGTCNFEQLEDLVRTFLAEVGTDPGFSQSIKKTSTYTKTPKITIRFDSQC